MKDNINDGIVFDSTVYLSEENRRKFPVYMRFLQVLAISIGSHSFISIFLQSFELQIINKAFDDYYTINNSILFYDSLFSI